MSATLSDLLAFLDDPETCEIEYDGKPVKAFLDEWGFGASPASFFVAHDSYVSGPVLIHAKSYEEAWDAWIDSLPTIPEEEMCEAYYVPGTSETFYDAALRRSLMSYDPDSVRAIARADLRDCEGEPGLAEGYHYQSNASGTGIVSQDYTATLDKADPDLVTFRRKGAA